MPTKDLKDQSVTGSLKVGRATYEGETFWVFEPKDEYKGDFARAYFYMATCYGDELTWRLDNKDVGSKYAMRNDSYLEFRDWEIEVLITWHRQDPVSEKETKRMDAVSDFQHNRNPFIDYPDLAEYIWGNKKGTSVNLAELTGEVTSLPASTADTPSVRKVIRNGQVLIERDGCLYTVFGQPLE